ncbi:hypothetical protein [Fibrobacter succinogenes]|uniref:hypothetical protein n=1 Tax=Fibrobacter succinogenes TaxID=833 RepID=UPI001568EAF5|nr:hypothetical protein [Fibrobacter succinogenes]
MNIRKFWRLSCLTVASFFWASCSESNPQFPVAQSANPDSSADANGEGFGDESSSPAVAPESSSSEIAAQSSSSEISVTSSAAVESSSSAPIYALARDSSVTCEEIQNLVPNPRFSYSACDDYQKRLSSDMNISEKILTEWEEKLQSCEAIPEMSPAVYGIEPTVSYPTVIMETSYKCSNDSTYENCVLDDNLIYTSRQEYNEAHGISSSSSPESSSSATDLVKSCAQGDFALFVDILAEVQTALYEKFSKQLEENSSLNEKGKEYLEGLLDHEKKAFKANLAPYMLSDYYDDTYGWGMSRKTDLWFNGYIAKTKTCEDGTRVITDRYKEKYDAILAECIEIIENKVNGVSAD